MKKVYTFKCEKACRSLAADSEGREIWTLTIPASELPLEFKYGPNARSAEENAPIVKTILTTLANNPGDFVFLNGGLVLVVDSIAVSSNTVQLTCEEEGDGGHGVLNGGHTYRALLKALNSDEPKYAHVKDTVQVMTTVMTGIETTSIADISRARNTSVKVPDYALRALKGDWENLKKVVSKETRPLVEYKPGDPEAPEAPYNITDLIRRVLLLHAERYPMAENKHPVEMYTSYGNVLIGLKDADLQSLQKYVPLLPDVLWLEEQIFNEYLRQNGKPRRLGLTTGCSTDSETKLLTGNVVKVTMPAPFVWPIMAAFRTYLDVTGRKAQWVKPLHELWAKWGPHLVKTTWDLYHERASSSPAFFGRDRTTWRTIANEAEIALLRDKS